MYYKQIFAALVGLSSMANAAPALTERDVTPAEKGLKHKSRAQKRSPLLVQQDIIIEPQITVVEQNLGALNQLATIAEQQFAALVQAQVALVTQLETIKNNIRVNHFKARFNQVNTVIVTVTNVVDARDPNQSNKRYLLNQLVADNGFPDKLNLVMVSDKQEMTIGASPTLNLDGLQVGSATALSTPTATPGIQNFNANAPFGAFNGSVLLPFNTSTPALPANALILEDPANIIFPGNPNLFVQSSGSFAVDCTNFVAQQSSFLNLASALLYPSIDAAIAAQLAALQIGVGTPIIPPSVLLGNPQLAGQVQQQPQQQQQTAQSAPAAPAATPAAPQVVGGSAAPAPAPEAAAAPAVVSPAPEAAAPAATERVIPTLTAIAGR